MAGRLRAIVLGAALGALAPVAPAPAASVDAGAAGLTYRAGAGEANRVTVAFGAGGVDIADGGVPALLGCAPLSPGAVRCPLPTGDPSAGPLPCTGCLVRFETGDRDDVARVAAAPAGLLVMLDGGPGDDRLLTLAATPRPPAEVRCGTGEDSAWVARGDRVSPDCEHVEVGALRSPRLRIEGPRTRRARRGSLRIVVGARRGPAGATPIAGTVVLRAAGGRPRAALARARLSRLVVAGRAAVTLRLTLRARRELTRRAAIAMRVTIHARDARGGESVTRRVLRVRR